MLPHPELAAILEVETVLELLIALSVIIIVSATCSLFEAVLLSAPVSHIEKLAADGKASGRIFRELRQNVDRPLSAILSLNTIANTGGAVFAGAAFVRVFGGANKAYFTIFLTLVVLFLCEVVPKTVGAVYSSPLAPFIARPLRALIFVFTPIIAVCRMLTRAVARGHAYQEVSGEELIVLAKLGRRAGTIDADEARVIQNILSLKDKQAKDVMTPRTVVFSLHEDLTVKEAFGKSPVWQYSRVPIYAVDSEDIVGVVLRGEALGFLSDSRENARLSDLMRPVHFVPDNTSLDRILENFLEQRQHMFIVIDEYGGVAGILTLEDVLEEILGKEIVDELDQVTDMRELARKRRKLATRITKRRE